MAEITLIIGALALALAIALVALSIVAIYYALQRYNNSMSGNLNVGSIAASGNISTTQTITATGNITTNDLVTPKVNGTGVFTNTGSVGITGNSTTGILNVTNTTDSISTTTGSIILAGGLATAKDTYTNESIVFPTILIGATATPLNYYEEFVFNTSLSGIWFGPESWAVTFVRAGKSVTMQWPSVTATATIGSFLQSSGTIPARFLPSTIGSVFYVPAYVINNSANTLGLITISSGLINIAATPASGNFTSSGTGGINSGSTTWSL